MRVRIADMRVMYRGHTYGPLLQCLILLTGLRPPFYGWFLFLGTIYAHARDRQGVCFNTGRFRGRWHNYGGQLVKSSAATTRAGLGCHSHLFRWHGASGSRPTRASRCRIDEASMAHELRANSRWTIALAAVVATVLSRVIRTAGERRRRRRSIETATYVTPPWRTPFWARSRSAPSIVRATVPDLPADAAFC